MSRRRIPKNDSLELLLDTICNTFGGVLFIAILVVLLLQQSGNNPVSATPAAVPVSAVEMGQMTARMQAVNDELAQLQLNRNSQDEIVQSFAPDTVRQLIADRRRATANQESLQADVDRLLSDNAALVTKVESLSVENAGVRVRLEQSRDRLQSIESELNRDRQSRVEDARLPVNRTDVHKAEVGLVLRYGRLYIWHKYGGGANDRLGLNTDEFVVISEEAGGLTTRPKPSAGTILDGSDSSNAAVGKTLRRFAPNECYFVVVARPDSYGVFRHLRDQIIELGFEYRLMPTATDDPVTDRGGKGGDVQ